MTEDIQISDRLVFRHKISENLPCNTYSMHTHNIYEVIYFLDGDASHVIEDRKYKLKKGDLILIRPFQYHFIQIDMPSRYERYDLLFDPQKHHIEGMERIPTDVEVIHLADNNIVADIFRKCDLYHQNSDRDTFEKIIPHLLSELFYNISLFPHSFSDGATTLSPMICKALKYINENLCMPLETEDIARHLFVSESYLFRLFRKELHQTPKNYIMEKRLFLAQKMIAAGEKASFVCEHCGFGNYTTFYRNYISFFGISPSEKKAVPPLHQSVPADF